MYKNEKEALLISYPGILSRPMPSRRMLGIVWQQWLAWILIATSIGLTIHKIYTTVDEVVSRDPRTYHPPRIHSHPFTGEKKGLRWEPCGTVNGRKLECTRLDVPMDHFNATNSGDKVFNLPIVRMLGDADAKNILINPGGPGGSGFEFIYRAGELLSNIIGTGHHLVGFDPRGVNGSRPQALCYADANTRKELSIPKIPSQLVEDSPQRYAHSKGYVQACIDVSGEYGKYINTPQTAADMNTIMDALGQEEMIYWGFSYGTILGQTYAALFPERSHRVMIDGVCNVFSWYNQVLGTQHGGLQDTDRVIRGFFEECAKAGEDCPLTTHGKTADEIHDKIYHITEELANQPLSVYVNSTKWSFLAADHIIYNALFMSAYKPSKWWTLADSLSQLLSGNATSMYLAYGSDQLFQPDTDDSNSFVHNNDAPTGPEYWPHTREEALDMALPLLNDTLFMLDWLSDLHQMQNWAVPKTHSFHPQKGIRTAHPLFISSNTYDPVTPLAFAKIAHEAFIGSGLVEVKGLGHGSIAMPSNCYAKHVRAFLYNGTLPDGHVTCGVDGKYFMKPEESLGTVEFLDYEDQAIYRAQVELAKLENWPYARPGWL